jgi:predicted HTH transcriptional regulator
LLLETDKNILAYKQEVMKIESALENESRPKPEPRPASPEPARKVKPKTENIPEVNETKKKIIAFIRTQPQIRAKEILVELSSISNRTIKRNLKELVDSGMVIRYSDNGIIYYSSR